MVIQTAVVHIAAVSGNRSFLWQVDQPDLGLYLPCGIGCAAAFVRGVWAAGLVVALVLFFVER